MLPLSSFGLVHSTMANLRFYTPHPLKLDHVLSLSESAATHATKALRLNIGDHIILFNGDGFDYACELISIAKNKVLARVLGSTAVQNESPLNITLIQAISSGDRMDFTIQKAVELGVKHILPVTSQRSVVKLTAERAAKRTEHWQNIAISACEQSGRAYVPTVNAPLNFSQLFLYLNKTAPENACNITLSPEAKCNLRALNKPAGPIFLLIGAEGGLTVEEIGLSNNYGFQSVLLGPRILRTETAALTAITAMQTLWGDF
jgi:16S rRNA (uracil1498-N3)-methyltransferase